MKAEPLSRLVKECKLRGIYWTGGPWCDWVTELDARARKAEARVEELEREKERLEAWLLKIEGGDTPCTDEAQLRQWAYEAVTLRKPAQDQNQ